MSGVALIQTLSGEPATRQAVQLDALEPRLCFSATPIGGELLAEELLQASGNSQAWLQSDGTESPQSELPVASAQSNTSLSLIFIDGGVDQKDLLRRRTRVQVW